MKKDLLYTLHKKDFKLQTFKSGGPGGQHQNKTDSGVRIIHPESGAVGQSRKHKSQYQNRKIALKRLVEHPKFKVWNIRKCQEIIDGKTLEQKIEEMMVDRNLKYEIQEDEKWVEWKELNEKSSS